MSHAEPGSTPKLLTVDLQAAFWYRMLWEELLPDAALNEDEVTPITSLGTQREVSHPQF